MTQNNVGIYASQISGHLYGGPYGAYDSLATVTVPSGGIASIEFAGIPTGYKHLQIRCLSRTLSAANGGDTTKIRFNSDSTTNYSTHVLDGYQGASAGVESTAGASTTYSTVFISSEGGQASGIFSASIIDILDYQNTNKYKTTRGFGGYDINGSTGGYNYIGMYSGNWRSTAAISSITLFNALGNFAQYSSFALYGVK